MGQVNTLVLLGIALFLFFSRSDRDFAAGAALALTTIKPHLVIITLPLLLLHVTWQRRWHVLAGFLTALAACALVLFLLYPPWLLSFLQVITSGMSGFREAPTISGLLVHAQIYAFGAVGKWLWFLGLCGAVALWWRTRQQLDERILIDLSLLAGMILAPVGWSYDQVMLLVPVMHILEWMSNNALGRRYVLILMSVLIAADLLSFYQRTWGESEVWFFWLPMVLTVVYLAARKRVAPALALRP
jgi:hypothetical protein